MLKDHNELLDIAFCVFVGKADEVNWEKVEKPIIHNWDLITWGPEAKLLSRVIIKSWNNHGKDLIKNVKNAFTLGKIISVDRKKVERTFAKDKNIGKKVWKDVSGKVNAILQAVAHRATGYYQKQSKTKKIVRKQDETAFGLFVSDALSDHIENFIEEYPDKFLHKEVVRLVDLAEKSEELRVADKALLTQRIERIDKLGPDYFTNMSDVSVGRTWNLTGLEMAYQNDIEEYMVVAHVDDVNKPCSPCTRLHGRHFSVVKAREAVMQSLADPSGATQIPFPRTGDLDAMSPSDIRDASWSPPFHGRCRCDVLFLWKKTVEIPQEMEPGSPISETERLKRQKFKKIEKVGTGESEPWKAILDDGTKAIWKEEAWANSIKSDIGAFNLSDELGFDLVPPTWLDEEGVGSLQKWVEGIIGDDLSPDDLKKLLDSTDMKFMKIFDYCSLNRDRHAGNFIYDKVNDKLWGIDNGFSLAKGPDTAEAFHKFGMEQWTEIGIKGHLNPDEFKKFKELVDTWDMDKISGIVSDLNKYSLEGIETLHSNTKKAKNFGELIDSMYNYHKGAAVL